MNVSWSIGLLDRKGDLKMNEAQFQQVHQNIKAASQTKQANTALQSKRPAPTQCKVCGLVLEARYVGNPAFGRWFTFDLCPDCKRDQDLKELEIERLRQQRQNRAGFKASVNEALTEIPPLFRSARLGQLKPELQQILTSPASIYLWGGVGCGKTYAAMATLRAGAVRGKTIKRVVFESLLSELRRFTETEDSILSPYLKADIVVIDDPGISNSDFSKRILFQIIDGRVEQLKKTVLTSNLSLEKIKGIVGERVFSRIQTYSIVKLTTKDQRTPSISKGPTS